MSPTLAGRSAVDSVEGDDAPLWVVGQMWATCAPQWGGSQ